MAITSQLYSSLYSALVHKAVIGCIIKRLGKKKDFRQMLLNPAYDVLAASP